MRRGFAPGFANYKTRCTRLAAASDKVYQVLVHGRWLSSGTPASSTTKTGRHDIAQILLKLALNTTNQSINCVTNDNGYAPLSQSQSCHIHSWLPIRFSISKQEGATSGAGTTCFPDHLWLSRFFLCWVRVAQSSVFRIALYKSMIVFLSFFFWPLHCLSIFGLSSFNLYRYTIYLY